MNTDKPIGVFDSGIGGLTVLKEIHSQLPSEDILYLGDTARVPYGTKSKDTVLRYTIRNSLFLLEKEVKAIVIACNTASAYGLDVLQNHFKVPIIGVIRPGARAAVAQTKSHRVGVIGTEGTIRSGAYQKAMTELDPRIEIQGQACPLLVALAEEGWVEGPVVTMTLQTYLKPFLEASQPVDTLILGCTHYPLLKAAIGAMLGPKIELIDSAVETARSLSDILQKNSLQCRKDRAGSIQFFSTDAPERMERIGHYFLGSEMKPVSMVDISF